MSIFIIVFWSSDGSYIDSVVLIASRLDISTLESSSSSLKFSISAV